MGTAIRIIREDHTVAELRALAANSNDADQVRRLLAIAMIHDGTSRLDAARQAGMDCQTLHDWVHRRNEAGIDGLVSRKPPGASPKLTQAQMGELCEVVIAGPDPQTHKVVRWRCVDLRAEVARRFSVIVPERTIGKWLRKLKLTQLQPRPYHPKKDATAQEAFKKSSGRRPACGVENWPCWSEFEGSGRKVFGGFNPVKNMALGLFRNCES
jgi:transposase